MNTSALMRILRSKNVTLLIVAIAIFVLFGLINHDFISVNSAKNIMNSMSFTGMIAVGMSMLLIAGEVDLASGAESTLCGVIAGMLIQQVGLPWPLAFIVAILCGMLFGLINAFFVNKIKIMGFIATIGIMGIYNGIISQVTGNHTVPVGDQTFWLIGSTQVFGVFPLPFVIMVVLMIVYAIILNMTSFGRNVYMVGGNRRAARLCGINQPKIVAILYMNNGAIAAFAGVILAARMHSASPMAGGTVALDAITAAVLGGVSFLGGVGGIECCFFGILLLCSFNAGLTASGLGSYYQLIAQGGLLVVALSVDFFSSMLRKRSLERQESLLRSKFYSTKKEEEL